MYTSCVSEPTGIYSTIIVATKAQPTLGVLQLSSMASNGVKCIVFALACIAFTAAQTPKPESFINEPLIKKSDKIVDELSGGDSTVAMWIKGVFALIGLFASLGAIFAGYKMIYPVLFCASFFFGACVSYDILIASIADETTAYVAFVIGGVLAAVIALHFYDAGIFAIGAVAGGYFGFLLNVSATSGAGVGTHALFVHYAILAVGALVGGWLAWTIEQPALIIATAFGGSAILVGAIGHFAGGYPTQAQITDIHVTGSSGVIMVIPTTWWGYLAATLGLFIAGAYVQFNYTAKHVDHIHGSHLTMETMPLRSAYRA
jgi:hypothetical protein